MGKKDKKKLKGNNGSTVEENKVEEDKPETTADTTNAGDKEESQEVA